VYSKWVDCIPSEFRDVAKALVLGVGRNCSKPLAARLAADDFSKLGLMRPETTEGVALGKF
jgi:hypothetical protein